MTDILLQTKISIPTVRPTLVLRQRLLKKLQDKFQSRLTLISAPTGFGKTTLLSAWARTCAHPVAWVTLEESDNDPARFLNYLIAALEISIQREGQLLALLPAMQPSPNEFYLTHLVNQLSNLAREVAQAWVVILDDYHLIANESVHRTLAFMIDRAPATLSVVIATRADPPLPLARLRARGQLNELRQEDLRFTLQESVEFVTQVMKLDLDVDNIAALMERTEGWPAGLQLATVSLQDQIDPNSLIAQFSGSHRFIVDYLLEEVLERQPEEVRLFLLYSSILDQLSVPLCQAVLVPESTNIAAKGKTRKRQLAALSSQAIMEYIERANLFLIPLDNQRIWYRYHHLFGDFLSACLEKEQPDLIPELHRRAAGWYYRNGMVEEAIKHAFSSQDFGQAAEWIEQLAEETIKHSQIITLKAWLETLPESVLCSRHMLCIYHAWTLLLSGHSLEAIQARLQQALQHGGVISGKARVLSAFIATFQGDFANSFAVTRQALQELDENDFFFRSIVAWMTGIMQAWEGDFRRGIQALDTAVQMSEQSGNIMMAVTGMSNQAELLAYLGELNEARLRYQRALQTALDDQGRLLPIAGMALIGLGDLFREWNDLPAAETHLLQGIELTQKWGQIGALDGYIGLARLRRAQGDAEGAHQAFAQAWQVARHFDATIFDDILVQAFQAQLWIAQSDIPRADAWAKTCLPFDLATPSFAKIQEQLRTPIHAHIRQIEQITLAWLWIERGNFLKTQDLLKKLIQPVAEQNKTSILLQIHILQAMAYGAQGNFTQAQTALETALAIGEPQGFIRTFLDFGSRAHIVIRQAAVRNPTSNYLRRLLVELDQEASFSQRQAYTPFSLSGGLLTEPLSERELQVLKRVAAGLSNPEIAQELVVANSTIKTHINHIFRKLEVRTRAQAVARARELGILA